MMARMFAVAHHLALPAGERCCVWAVTPGTASIAAATPSGDAPGSTVTRRKLTASPPRSVAKSSKAM